MIVSSDIQESTALNHSLLLLHQIVEFLLFEVGPFQFEVVLQFVGVTTEKKLKLI
jgi:hypothetical protein